MINKKNKGSEIISSNMAKSGDVDPMIPGKKKLAIYGFGDIRNFTDATEVLQVYLPIKNSDFKILEII
jgi:hypothetical protein